MTLPVALELDDSPCSVADCLEAAVVLGSATVDVTPGPGLPPDFGEVTVGVPLCMNHARLLEHGCNLRRFSSGL